MTPLFYSRWVQTVPETVAKYCLIETDPHTQIKGFRCPALEVRGYSCIALNTFHGDSKIFLCCQDIVDADIIVATLSTSRSIAKLLSPGHFTHILVDEAAQVCSDWLTLEILASDWLIVTQLLTSDGLNIQY